MVWGGGSRGGVVEGGGSEGGGLQVPMTQIIS